MDADVFAYIGYIVLLINTVLYMIRTGKREKAVRLFAMYCFTMLVVQLASFYLRTMKMNNLFLMHFYFILQFIMLSFFYLDILKEPSQKKTVKIMLLICPIVLLIQYLVKPELFYKFNSLEIFISSITLIIYATFHMYNQLNEARKFYYINTGILIYLPASMVIFLVGNPSLKLNSPTLFNAIWDLNIFLYLIYQLFILYEWKKNHYQIKPSQAS